ncbi:MAG TPA: HAMP domain-containing protein [Desulfuromonadales bacterium]|nr:HAMP domain-containing protein [Desulfuromonadales bacterium]
MLRSKLFARIFFPSTIAIVVLFAAMYLLSVPFTQSTVEKIEENASRTILNNVYNMVEQANLELQNYRQSITLERKQQLNNILSVADARIRELLAAVRSGSMTREQARRTLLNELRLVKYGRNDYIWASDYNSVLISHPDPKLNNADFSKVRDTRGNLVVPPMVAMARKGAGDGYYSYWWRRLGEEHPVEKITYFRHIPEFSIVIGTGVYLDDIENMVQTKKNIAIDNLRERLRQTKIAKTGYIYIFDGQFVMQIHPNANIEYTNVSLMLDQSTRKPLFPLLVSIADKEQGLRYLWDKPSEPEHYIYGKISWVRYYKEFDWYICSSAYLDELSESARIVRNRVLAIFITTLLISIALIYLFVKKLTAPLLQIRDTALRVIDGDLDARCPLKRDDEIGIVATALDSMVGRLQGNILNLDAKIAERTAELEKAFTDLKEMDQIKSDFLTTVSHELRTPMTSVVGFIQQIRKKLEAVVFPAVEPGEKSERAISQIRNNLDIVANESDRLTRLINDLLYCATLEAGKVEWNFSRVAPDQLLKRVVAVFSPLAEQKGLELLIDTGSDIPAIRGDENRLFNALSNLLGNAIKFTSRGRIILRVGRQDECVLFSVQDSGCGIAEDVQQSIFEKFRQIGDTLTAKPEGTGLGLPISQQIIVHHGGKIWVESTPDVGSTFFFTVPIDTNDYHNIQLDI